MLHPYLLPSYTQEAELPLRRMCQRNVRMLSSVCLLFVAYGMDHGEGGGIEDSIMHFEHAACLIRIAPMRLTAAIIIEAALLGCRARRHFNLTQHNVMPLTDQLDRTSRWGETPQVYARVDSRAPHQKNGGCNAGYISRIGRGQIEPCLGTLETLAHTFGLALSEFLEGVQR